MKSITRFSLAFMMLALFAAGWLPHRKNRTPDDRPADGPIFHRWRDKRFSKCRGGLWRETGFKLGEYKNPKSKRIQQKW